MKNAYSPLIGFASCSLAPNDQDKAFQIVPLGDFRASDGRPRDIPTWRLTLANALNVIRKVRSRRKPLLIDYEHQTLESAKNGLPAPAAGWIKDLELKENRGIYAVGTEWTPKAKAYLKAKEYRYISPVFSYSKKTGEVLDILHIALTNTPALSSLPEIPITAAAKSQGNVIETLKPTLGKEEIAICSMMGISTEEYARQKEIDSYCVDSSALASCYGVTEVELEICQQLGLSPDEYALSK
ncbi:phage protease [Sedimenticola selenatireducens]|uniref:phage protease n=1 Tax=Sedimenticola selenatireducens TaxID=191960 RepID=UPI000687015F|nr:phage protease [Sedimenticola selenatireducens]